MKWPGLIFAALMLMCLTGSCGRDAARRMDLADSLMEQNADSAYALLSSIDTAALSGTAMRARHALLSTQARVKTERLGPADTASIPLLEYYDSHGSDFDRMRAAFYLAEIYKLKKNYAERIKALNVAEELALDKSDKYWLAKIYEAKSDIYNTTGYLNEAINCMQKSRAFYHAVSRTLNEAFLCCDIALGYYNLSDYKTSQQMLDSLRLLYARELNQSPYLRAYMLDLTVSNLIGEDRKVEADSVNRLFREINPTPTLDFHQLKNTIYLQIYCDTTGISANLAELKRRSVDKGELAYYYYMRYSYDSKRQDWPNAKIAMDSTFLFLNSGIQEALYQSVISAQLVAQTEKTNILADTNSTYLYIIVGMIAILFLGTLFVVIYRVNNQRKQNQKDAIVNEISAELAAQQLRFAEYKTIKESEIADLNHELSQAIGNMRT